MLEICALSAGYGTAAVLRDVSITIAEGERVCVLGRNGVGKTTLLRSVMGLTPPRAGSIELLGKQLAGMSPCDIAREGVGYVSQERALFGELSVEQNLFLGVRDKGIFRKRLPEVLDYFPVLRDRLAQQAGTLSGGQQQFAAIARALIARPRLLLLDEPSAGVQPSVVSDMGSLLTKVLTETGCALLLVEQNRRLAVDAAERAYILDRQTVVVEGTPSDLESRGEMERFLAF